MRDTRISAYPAGAPYPRQRVVRRNRLFVLLPLSALVASWLLALWEILRINVRSGLPWNVQLLDVNSATTLGVALGALILTRLQYAQAIRPALGWRISPSRQPVAQMAGRSESHLVWKVDVFNGGGRAVVESVAYRLEPDDGAQNGASWLDFYEAINAFQSLGLSPGVDFVLEEWGSGAPLVQASDPSSAMPIGFFSTAALQHLTGLDVLIRFTDTVGDLHERMLDCGTRVHGVLRNSPGSSGPVDAQVSEPDQTS